MDLLKRSLAPITQEAWEVIDEEAVKALKTSLSARRFVDIEGPFGWNYHGWPLGRIETSDSSFVDGAEHGIRLIQPLVEVRVPFAMDCWDLDDISRGSATTDLTSLQDAARKIALFEEKAIYTGLEKASIQGMEKASDNTPVPVPDSDDGVVDAVVQAALTLKNRSIEGPYCLVCQKDLWKRIFAQARNYPARMRIEAIAEKIVLSPLVDKSFLVSTRGGDMTLVLGQDLSIGYFETCQKKVHLYYTESFTFTVPGPEVIVPLKVD